MLRSLSNGWARPRSLPRGRLAAARHLPRGLLVVAITRLGLSLSSLTALRARWLPPALAARHDVAEVARVAWSVRMASYLVPFASCLTQAQACQILLAHQGIASTLCLGVREQHGDRLEAHAWLVCDDRLVLGGDVGKIAAFRVLAELGPLR